MALATRQHISSPFHRSRSGRCPTGSIQVRSRKTGGGLGPLARFMDVRVLPWLLPPQWGAGPETNRPCSAQPGMTLACARCSHPKPFKRSAADKSRAVFSSRCVASPPLLCRSGESLTRTSSRCRRNMLGRPPIYAPYLWRCQAKLSKPLRKFRRTGAARSLVGAEPCRRFRKPAVSPRALTYRQTAGDSSRLCRRPVRVSDDAQTQSNRAPRPRGGTGGRNRGAPGAVARSSDAGAAPHGAQPELEAAIPQAAPS